MSTAKMVLASVLALTAAGCGQLSQGKSAPPPAAGGEAAAPTADASGDAAKPAEDAGGKPAAPAEAPAGSAADKPS